jgi:hypothetical protein
MGVMPSHRLSRRTALIGGAVALSAARCVPRAPADEPVADPEVARAVRLIESKGSGTVAAAIVDALRAGGTEDTWWAAVLLTGARNANPAPVGGSYHCVLMVDAMRSHALVATGEERWVPLLLNARRIAQVREKEASNPFTLGPTPTPADGDPVARFNEALAAQDTAAADAAVVALYQQKRPAEVEDVLIQASSRRIRFLGHEAIFVAKKLSVLRSVGFGNGLELVRAMAHGLTNTAALGSTNAGPDSTPVHAENLQRAERLRSDWESGSTDEAGVIDLLGFLRTADAASAAERVLTLSDAGLSADALWNGITLASAELALNASETHGQTSINALRHASQLTLNPAVRRHALLQGASWVTLMRESYRLRGVAPPQDLAFDALAPEAAADLTEALSPTSSKSRVLRLLHLFENVTPAADLIPTLRAHLLRTGDEEHVFKHSASTFDDAAWVGGRWRNALVAMSAINMFRTTAKESADHVNLTAALQ